LERRRSISRWQRSAFGAMEARWLKNGMQRPYDVVSTYISCL
jgi:hypothetical protein